MVKIKYVGISGSVASQGIKFQKNKPYEVSEEVAKYLKDSFGKNFEILEEPKPKAVEKPIVVETKPKPKRAVKPKVVAETE